MSRGGQFQVALAAAPSHGYIRRVADKLIEIHSNLAAVRDHSRTFADFTFVYPVISRRSRGLSIGINLNPDKVCNFDCVYCEVDRKVPGKVSRVDLNQMRDELQAYCDRLNEIVHAGGRVKEVQAYTVARPTPEPFAERLSSGELDGLARVIRQSTGLRVSMFD